MKNSSPYETLIVLTVACIVVHLFTAVDAFLWIGLVFCITGLFVPALASMMHTGWMKFAAILGVISSTILLTLVYIGLILPVSLFMRNRISMKARKSAGAWFRQRDHIYVKTDFENPW